MGPTYSSDLRKSFLAAVAGGMTASAAARLFSVSRSTGVRWVILSRKEVYCETRRGGDRRSHRLEKYWEQILEWITETPDTTLPELSEKLECLGVKVSESSISRLLKRHGMTYKKRQHMQRSKSGKMLHKRERNGGRNNRDLMLTA